MRAPAAHYEKWQSAHGTGESPSREDIARAMAGHLCRCGAYARELPPAHAKAVSIDTSEAMRLPGVRAVVDVLDDPHRVVRFVGHPILAIATESEAIALEALDAVRIEYDVRTLREGDHHFGVVFDFGPCVHPHPSSIGCALLTYEATLDIAGRDAPLPIGDFFGTGENGLRDNTLEPGKLVIAIRLPPPRPGEARRARRISPPPRRSRRGGASRCPVPATRYPWSRRASSRRSSRPSPGRVPDRNEA